MVDSLVTKSTMDLCAIFTSAAQAGEFCLNNIRTFDKYPGTFSNTIATLLDSMVEREVKMVDTKRSPPRDYSSDKVATSMTSSGLYVLA